MILPSLSRTAAPTLKLEYGHSTDREFAFLAVHGYLHLCGYDHQTEAEEKEMFSLQEEILTKAGLTR